jgi:hypothetical protein
MAARPAGGDTSEVGNTASAVGVNGGPGGGRASRKTVFHLYLVEGVGTIRSMEITSAKLKKKGGGINS